MALMLWRGRGLLGELRMHLSSTTGDPRPRQFRHRSAFLIPAKGAALEGVQQMRISIGDEPRVFQQDIAPMDSTSEPTDHHRQTVELEPVPPEEAFGVPRHDQLRIVNEQNEELDTRAIALCEMRYDAEMFARIQHGIPGEAMEPIPTEAFVDGSVWVVLFSFDPSPA